MTLSYEDAQLFYWLWFQLLDYTNCKFKVNGEMKSPIGKQPQNAAEFKKIADVIWNDISIIDAFIEDCSEGLEASDVEIVRSWKRRIRDRFILERHLQKGSIFISMTDQQVYQVKGLLDSWPEMLQNAPLPLAVDATLIPFKGVLISDGLVAPYRVFFGHNTIEEIKDIYRSAKRNGSIRTTI